MKARFCGFSFPSTQQLIFYDESADLHTLSLKFRQKRLQKRPKTWWDLSSYIGHVLEEGVMGEISGKEGENLREKGRQ